MTRLLKGLSKRSYQRTRRLSGTTKAARNRRWNRSWARSCGHPKARPSRIRSGNSFRNIWGINNMNKSILISVTILVGLIISGCSSIKTEYSAEAWLTQGNVLNECKAYKEAIIAYNKAVEINPDYAEAYNNRGIAEKNKGDYDE